MTIKYSICVVNLNMQQTIKIALESVLKQIDDSYEVIVVDDGSSDESVTILRDLEKMYPSMKVFELQRDRRRTLAETRNISCSYARGEYLILQIDCDDFWYPHIRDFVDCFHEIEKVIGREFLLSGHQIHIGSRDFLLRHGPYRTGHTGEDRDLWYRMALLGRWLLVDHVVFRVRLPLTLKQRLRKIFVLSALMVRDELRAGSKISDYSRELVRSSLGRTLKYRVYLFSIALLFRPFIRLWPRIESIDGEVTWSNLKKQALLTGTIRNFLAQNNRALPEHISEKSKWLFSHSRYSNEYPDSFPSNKPPTVI